MKKNILIIVLFSFKILTPSLALASDANSVLEKCINTTNALIAILNGEDTDFNNQWRSLLEEGSHPHFCLSLNSDLLTAIFQPYKFLFDSENDPNNLTKIYNSKDSKKPSSLSSTTLYKCSLCGRSSLKSSQRFSKRRFF